MSNIELGKTYRTRDGREVRIYAVDGGKTPSGHRYAVHGAIKHDTLGWEADQWAENGRWKPYGDQTTDNDLIEARPRIKLTMWVNVYRTTRGEYVAGDLYLVKSDCPAGTRDRAACVKVEIDCEHGEGLS